MSIPETFHFDNRGEIERFPRLRPYFLTIIIALVALLSFGIGRLTGSSREGVIINYEPEMVSSVAPRTSTGVGEGAVTASSQGTRYYFSHCGNNISEKNKISFASVALAEQAGYTLAANCRPR